MLPKNCLILLIIPFLMLSCGKNIKKPNALNIQSHSVQQHLASKSNDKIFHKSKGPLPKSWQEYMQRVLDDDGAIDLSINGLQLISYRQLDHDQIQIDAILKKPFTKNSFLPVSNLKPNEKARFKLEQVFKTEQLRKRNGMAKRINRKRLMINHYKKLSALKVVRLHWNYKGNKIITNCIVNKKKVVYDDILTNLSTVVTISEISSRKINNKSQVSYISTGGVFMAIAGGNVASSGGNGSTKVFYQPPANPKHFKMLISNHYFWNNRTGRYSDSTSIYSPFGLFYLTRKERSPSTSKD